MRPFWLIEGVEAREPARPRASEEPPRGLVYKGFPGGLLAQRPLPRRDPVAQPTAHPALPPPRRRRDVRVPCRHLVTVQAVRLPRPAGEQVIPAQRVLPNRRRSQVVRVAARGV